MSIMYPGQRRRKKRYTHGVKSVEVTRGKNGYGFTISGQQPCILSCIVSGSPADRAGLKTGDYLMAVNNLNVSKASHDEVVRLIGSSSGLLVLQIAENCNDSDSSDEEFQNRPKSKYPNRVRFRQVNRNERDPAGAARENRAAAVANRYAGLIQKNSSQGKTRSRSPRRDGFGREIDHVAGQDHQDRLAMYQPRARGVENVNPLSVSVYPGRQKQLNGVGPPPGVKVRTGTHGGKHTIITREARLVKANNPDGFDPVRGPSQALNHEQPPQSFTPQDLSNILFPSFQAHVNRGHVHVNDNEEEGELSDGMGEANLRVIVGYVGSIEMPRDANLPSSRLQSIRSAVRRLRIEHKVHTLVLMLIFPGGVRMTNTMGSTVAHYPAEKVAFSGVCPDDRRFFGIVTLHGASSDEISSDNGSVEDFMSGSSCHVFMVDPELRSHSAHMHKARSFGIQCTVDPMTHRCLEFPKSCAVILRNVAKLYRDRQGGLYEAEIVNANGLAAGNYAHAPQASDISNSSNSDSGLGFCREDSGNDPVYVVEMPQEENAGAEGDNSRWELEQSVFSTPNHGNGSHARQHSAEESDVVGLLPSRCPGSGMSNPSPGSQANTSSSSNELAVAGHPSNQKGPVDRLNIRAMPDPRGFLKEVSQDILESQNSADNLRRSMHKLLQSRQRRAESSSDVESLRSNESNHSGATGSQTNLSRSDSVQSQIGMQCQAAVQAPAPAKSANQSSFMGTSGNFSFNSSSASCQLEVSRNSSANDSKLSPRATVGKRSGAVPFPVLIPSVPDPPVCNTDMDQLSEPLHIHNPSSPIPNKPPIPERRPVVPRNQPRTPAQPPKPASERPKSTPPIPSVPPIAMEEEYDSDPGNVSGIGPLAGEEEEWGGKIEEPKEEEPNRRFSEGYIMQKRREKDQELHRKLNKGGSFKQLRNKRRPTLSNSHESLVASDASEFSRPQKLNGAASITSVAHEIKDDENGNDTTGRASTWALAFEKLLQDKAGLATFTEFLKKEFSEENIQFWCDCENYKKLPSQEERRLRARELFDRHLSDRATDAINIDSHARRVTEQGLDEAVPTLLDVSQKQIFTLMKQDSYSRFLKSDLYKQCVVAEMEGKPLPFPGEDSKYKEEKRMMKKSRSASSTDGDEKRRKSLLLPWNRNKSDKRLAKVTTDPDLHKPKEEQNGIPVKGSLDLADLSLISKEVSPSQEEENPGSDLSKDKFCRVILPDGSTTVMSARFGQTVYGALRRLCDRRNMSFVSMEVLLVGSDKPLDLSKDISTLGSKEIKMEKRILFRVDLPSRKVIGVKAKPNRNIRDVFRPILTKYGYKIENMVIHMASTGIPLHLDTEVSTMEGQRISVQTLEDFTEWGGFGSHRGHNGKPPLPRSRSVLGSESLDDITNQVFKDLMEGKADAMQQFDELGILDPERKMDDKAKGDENRNSGLLGFIRRNSIGDKDKNKMKLKAGLNLPRQKPIPARPYQKDPEEDRFFELLSRVQGHRLDDQRGLTADQLELPDFLRTEQVNGVIDQTRDSPIRRLERRNSDSSIMEYNPENRKLSRSLSQEGDIDRNAHPSNAFGTPNSKIPYVDQSFSNDGVMPSHGEAENYFSETYNYPSSPNFNDSKLMDKSLRDIGIGRTSQSSLQANTPISKLPLKLSPRAKTPVPRAKPPAPPVPVPRRKLEDHMNDDTHLQVVSSSDLDKTLLNTSCHSPLPPPPSLPEGPVIQDEAPNYPPPTPLVGHIQKGAIRTQYSQNSGQKGNVPVPARRYKKRSQSATRTDKNTPINSLPGSRAVGFVTDSDAEVDSDSTSQSLELSNVRLSVSTPSPTTHDLVLGMESSPERAGDHPRPPPRRSRKNSKSSTSSLSSPEDQEFHRSRSRQHKDKESNMQVSFV